MKKLHILYIGLSFVAALAILQKVAKNEMNSRNAEKKESQEEKLPPHNMSYDKQVCEDCQTCCKKAADLKGQLSRSDCYDKIMTEIKVPFLPDEMIKDIANSICYQDKSGLECNQALCIPPVE